MFVYISQFAFISTNLVLEKAIHALISLTDEIIHALDQKNVYYIYIYILVRSAHGCICVYAYIYIYILVRSAHGCICVYAYIYIYI